MKSQDISIKRELCNTINNDAQCSSYMIPINFVLHRQHLHAESEQWKKTSIDVVHGDWSWCESCWSTLAFLAAAATYERLIAVVLVECS